MALEDPVDPNATASDGSATDYPSIQAFDDGSTLQTFDDGSTLATATDGTTSATDAPSDTAAATTDPAVNPPGVGEVGSDQAGPPVSLAQAGVSGSSQAGPPAGVNFGATANTPAAAIATFGPARDLRAKLRVPYSYLTGPAAGPAGILAQNSGILFPYTPTISVEQKAEYGTSAPLHSNYSFNFFKNGAVGPINITAKFTVQNEYEGAVLLGVIHLLRALTKMKWGDEPDAGSPPPVCRFDAYGDYMLNNVPVAITSWRHELPDNVDYITVGRPFSAKTYGHSMVPSLSTIQLTLNVMYSRQEMLNYNVKDWLAGKLANKGYL